MSEIVHLRGANMRGEMVGSLAAMTERVDRGEVTGLVIVAVGPHLGQPFAHALTQGDVDHLIGQMERIKALLLMEARVP